MRRENGNAEKELLFFYCYLRSCLSEGRKPDREKVQKWKRLVSYILRILEEWERQ